MPMPLTEGQRTLPTDRAAGAPPPPEKDFIEGTVDIIPEQWRVARDENEFVQQNRLREKYRGVIEELVERGVSRESLLKYDGLTYTGMRNAGDYDRTKIWRAIAAQRAADPTAFAELGPDQLTYEKPELTRGGQRQVDQARIAAAPFEQQLGSALVGGGAAEMTKPFNIATLAVGGVGKTLTKRVITEVLAQGSIEAVQTGGLIAGKAALGEKTTTDEIVMNIATAGVAGGALRGGLELTPGFARKLGENVAGDWQRTRDYLWPRLPQSLRDRFGSKEAMQPDDMPDVAETLIGRDRMTQTERDALDVARDQQEVARTPFKPNGAGEELHMDLVGQALDALIDLPPVATSNFVDPVISTSGRFVFEPTIETDAKSQFYVEYTPEGASEPITAQVTLNREDGSAILNVNTDKIEGRAGEANTKGAREILRMRDEMLEAFPDIRSIEGERVTGPKAGTDASTFSLNEDQVARLRSRPQRNGAGVVGNADAEARFMARVRSAESSGDDAAKNPRSSATGRYQFIDSTWIRQFVKRYGRQGMSDDEILAKRSNGQIQDLLMKDLTAENAAFLRQQGEAVSEGNLYLVHFSGAGGAKKVFDANPNAPIEQVWSAEVIAANPFLKGMSAGDVISWAHRKMGQKGNAPRPGEGYELTEEATGLDGALAREGEELETIRRTLEDAYAAQDAARRAALGEQDSEAVLTALEATPAGRPFDEGEAFDEASVEPLEKLEPNDTAEQSVLRRALADLAHDTQDSLNDMGALTRRFEASEDELRAALDGMVARGTLTKNSKTGNYMRKPGSDPDELLETVARLGGLRDDEGNALGLNDLSARERRELDSNAQRNTRRNRKARGSRDWNKIMTRAGPLLRHEGRSVDEIGEGLWEAGWFTERPTTAQVLDLLEQRIGKGAKMYPPGREPGQVEAFDPDAETKMQSEWEEAKAAFRSEFTLGKAFDGSLDDMPDEAIMGRAAEIYRDSGGEVDAETAVVKALDEEYERVLEDLAFQDMEAEYGKRFDIFDPEWSARLDERIEQRRRADGARRAGRPGEAGNARARGQAGALDARGGTDAVDPRRLAQLTPEQRAPHSDPDGPAAKQQADSLVHDMRAELGFYTADEIGETTTVSLPSKKKGWKGGPDAEVSVGRTPDGNWTYSLSYTLPDRGEGRPFTKRDIQFSREAALRKGIFELQIKTAQAHDDDAAMIAAKNRIRKWAKEEMAKAQDAPEPAAAAPAVPKLGPNENSWIVVDRETGEAVLETSQESVAAKVNQEKYEVRTAGQHLGQINGREKPAGNPEFDEMLAQAKQRVADREATVAELAATGEPVRMTGKDGRKALVGKDMARGNEGFRATFFDAKGQPTNHVEYNSMEAALEDTLRMGFEADAGATKAVTPEAPIVRYRREAAEIEKSLPPPAEGMTRLWRGERPGDTGKGLNYTNDLAGIALPFREGYGGDLVYLDVTREELAAFEMKGAVAPGAEFHLPADRAAQSKVAEAPAQTDFAAPTQDQRRIELERQTEGRMKGKAAQKAAGSDGGLFDTRDTTGDLFDAPSQPQQLLDTVEQSPDLEAAFTKSVTDEDLDEAAAAYGIEDRAEAKARLLDDVVRAASEGIDKVAEGVRAIVQRLMTGLLSAALIINPAAATAKVPDGLMAREVIEAVEAPSAPMRSVPDAARAELSEDAALVYGRVADLAGQTDRAFIIVDKNDGRMHLFSRDGEHSGSTAVLTGQSRLDELSDARKGTKSTAEIRAIGDDAKVTPAGIRTADMAYAKGQDIPSLFLRTADGQSHMIAIHMNTSVSANRPGRLASDAADDNAITHGCITTTDSYWKSTMTGQIEDFDGALVFVMPHDRSKTVALLPERETPAPRGPDAPMRPKEVQAAPIVAGRESDIEFMLSADEPGKTGADLLAALDDEATDLKSIRDCL